MSEKQNRTATNVRTPSSLEEIRQLLLGLETGELLSLRSWLREPEKFSAAIAGVLPSAIRQRMEQDKELEKTLLPLIEQIILASVRKRPEVMADALYPVMAPAIRKSISMAIRSMLERINNTLENTFSVELLRLRLKALFTGKSYAELVLARSHFFSVKHVFLIHKETGLVIQQAHDAQATFEDVDMMTAMLTAIQDFVKDVFSGDIQQGDALDTIKIQDLNVWIEEGASALLVLVVEGYIPESYRPEFERILEEIHLHFGEKLRHFSGNEDDYQMLVPYLEQCLLKEKKKKKKKSPWKLIVLAVILAVLAGSFLFFRIRENRRYERLVEQLKESPGVVITDTWESGGHFHIAGLKDVSLHSFGKYATAQHIDSSLLVFHWKPYVSVEPPFVLKRFRKQFPVKDIRLSFRQGSYIVSGAVNRQQYDAIKDYFEMHPEIEKVDVSQLKIKQNIDFDKAKRKIESLTLRYKINVTDLNEEQKDRLNIICNTFVYMLKWQKEVKLIFVTYGNEKQNVGGNSVIARRRLAEIAKYVAENYNFGDAVQYELSEEVEKNRTVFPIVQITKKEN